MSFWEVLALVVSWPLWLPLLLLLGVLVGACVLTVAGVVSNGMVRLRTWLYRRRSK